MDYIGFGPLLNQNQMSQFQGLAKKATRIFRCLKEAELLGERYTQVVHPFLSGPIGGDASVYLSMGIEPHKIWAIDNDALALARCCQRWQGTGIQCLYDPKGIAHVLGLVYAIDHNDLSNGMAPYLDYCAQICDSCRETTYAIVTKLREGDVFSITHLRARDAEWKGKDRIEELLKDIQLVCPRAFLAQSIIYQSENHSPMMTLTFGIGTPKRAPVYLDLRHLNDKELMKLVSTSLEQKGYSHKDWLACFLDNLQPQELIMATKKVSLKQKRRNAALKAWRTIRANKKNSKK